MQRLCVVLATESGSVHVCVCVCVCVCVQGKSGGGVCQLLDMKCLSVLSASNYDCCYMCAFKRAGGQRQEKERQRRQLKTTLHIN